jgi:hypothetical protein
MESHASSDVVIVLLVLATLSVAVAVACMMGVS